MRSSNVSNSGRSVPHWERNSIHFLAVTRYGAARRGVRSARGPPRVTDRQRRHRANRAAVDSPYSDKCLSSLKLFIQASMTSSSSLPHRLSERRSRCGQKVDTRARSWSLTSVSRPSLPSACSSSTQHDRRNRGERKGERDALVQSYKRSSRCPTSRNRRRLSPVRARFLHRTLATRSRFLRPMSPRASMSVAYWPTTCGLKGAGQEGLRGRKAGGRECAGGEGVRGPGEERGEKQDARRGTSAATSGRACTASRALRAAPSSSRASWRRPQRPWPQKGTSRGPRSTRSCTARRARPSRAGCSPCTARGGIAPRQGGGSGREEHTQRERESAPLRR